MMMSGRNCSKPGEAAAASLAASTYEGRREFRFVNSWRPMAVDVAGIRTAYRLQGLASEQPNPFSMPRLYLVRPSKGDSRFGRL